MFRRGGSPGKIDWYKRAQARGLFFQIAFLALLFLAAATAWYLGLF